MTTNRTILFAGDNAPFIYMFRNRWALPQVRGLLLAITLVGCQPDSTASLPLVSKLEEQRSIVDPWRDSSNRCQEFSGIGTAGQLTGFDLDINGDGISEKFITCRGNHGTGGGSYWVYRKQRSGYIYIGELGFAVIRAYPDSQGHSLLALYWHMSSSDGIISWVRYERDTFVVLGSEEISCGDGGTEEGNTRWHAIFDTPALIRPMGTPQGSAVSNP